MDKNLEGGGGERKKKIKVKKRKNWNQVEWGYLKDLWDRWKTSWGFGYVELQYTGNIKRCEYWIRISNQTF